MRLPLCLLRSCFLSVLLAWAAPAASAQDGGADKSRYRLAGRVVDAATGEPLAGASVFLEGTTIGTATNAEGRYRIESVPAGSYLLVASMVGFAPASEKVALEARGRIRASFELKPRTVALPGLAVEESRAAWLERLERFKASFFGNGPYAAEVEILNPEVLRFPSDDETFRAEALEPLRMVNRALGYRITYHLTRFDERDGMMSYRGHIQFEELTPASAKEREVWAERRRDAYRGSFMHFARTLAAHRRLAGEGFRVYRTDRRGRRPTGRRVERAYKVLQPAVEETEAFLTTGGARYLRVEYWGGGGREVSWIEPAALAVLFDKRSGQTFDPYVGTLFGRWGQTTRVPNMLPREYAPPDDPSAMR